MQIRSERIRPNRPFELQHRPEQAASLVCLNGRDTDTVVGVGPGLCTLWVTLHGSLQLEMPDGVMTLPPRRFYVSNGDHPVRCIGQGGGWVALALPVNRLRAELREQAGSSETGPFLPAVLRLDRTLLRAVARLLRAAEDEAMSEWYRASLIRDYLGVLARAQHALEPLLQRCPGKTAEQRRQVLQRLLRARQRVELDHATPNSVAHMASVAHYSTCHFMRVFQQVFGESPYDFMLRTRMQRAELLLRRPNLAVTEIADRLGYSSSATFARVFKSYYGITATQLRERLRRGRGAGPAVAVPPRRSPRPQVKVGLAAQLLGGVHRGEIR